MAVGNGGTRKTKTRKAEGTLLQVAQLGTVHTTSGPRLCSRSAASCQKKARTHSSHLYPLSTTDPSPRTLSIAKRNVSHCRAAGKKTRMRSADGKAAKRTDRYHEATKSNGRGHL